MKTSAIFLFLLLAVSCKKDRVEEQLTSPIQASVCDVKYPVRELPWLRKLVEEAREENKDKILTIKLYEVNGKPVFNYYLSYMSCFGCISYLCDGSRIDLSLLSVAEMDEYNNKIVRQTGNTTVLWPEK